MGKSNIGQTGAKSIRLRGLPVDELPLGTGNDAKEQMADVYEVERLNAIADVKAQYPHHRVDYLTARINEAEQNKNRMRSMITDTQVRIQEYQGLMMRCGVRDDMLAELHEADADYAERRKVILAQWGRWDKKALADQIEQDKDAIKRFEEVIDMEDTTIKEHSEIISLCRERDKKLAKLGAESSGS